jgi:hypothetical protein
VPQIGDMVIVHEANGPGWWVRPAIVLWVNSPTDPASRLILSVIRWDELKVLEDVPHSAEPRDRHWSWR